MDESNESGHLVGVKPPAGGVFRARREGREPFAPPPWAIALARADKSFGGRFDDPGLAEGRTEAECFRVIYCATTPIACFGELLAAFRPSLSLFANLRTDVNDEETVEESLGELIRSGDPGWGVFPVGWAESRRLDRTSLLPELVFVDIASTETQTYLRPYMARLCLELGLDDLDLSTVSGPQRRLTQACARHFHGQLDELGVPRFAGIRYLSRHSADWECWAIFSDRLRHLAGGQYSTQRIDRDDSDLSQAAALGLALRP